MGNASSGGPGGASSSSSAATSADLLKAYVPGAEPERVDHWEVSRGVRRRDQAGVSIFRHAKTGGVNDELASNALKMARRMRHPLLLTFLDGVESDAEVLVVTESATPLSTHIRGLGAAKQAAGSLEWGLRCLASALVFLNEEAGLIHGNVQTSSVFVTPGGDWKFAGMELFGEAKGEPSPLLRQAQWVPDAYYKPPERRANDWALMARAPCWSLDVYGLACVWSDVFGGMSTTRSDPLAVASQLPAGLRDWFRQMLSASPDARPRPSAVLKSEWFAHLFVRSSLFIEELQLKPADKREPYFRSLAERAASFPPGALLHKFAPLLVQAVAFETREVNAHNAQAAASQGTLLPKPNALVPMLDAVLAVDLCVRQGDSSTLFEPALVDLFACNDRAVRIALLQRIDRVAAMLSAEALNGPLFDSALTGFLDATPMVRELTIKAMLHFAPRLNEPNKNDKLMRNFAKLQSDEQAAIRTNTVVCLGLIAPHLHPDTRRKVLAASFARALKDPFPPARIAGLKGLSQTHKLLALDGPTLASRILPSICPLLADPDRQVRAAAFEALGALVRTLSEAEAQAELAASEPSASGAQQPSQPQQQLPDQASGLLMRGLGWAAESISARIAAPEQPPPAKFAELPRLAASKPPPVPAAAATSWEEEDDDDMDFFAPQHAPPAQPKSAPKPAADASANNVDFFAASAAAPRANSGLKLKQQQPAKPTGDAFDLDELMQGMPGGGSKAPKPSAAGTPYSIPAPAVAKPKPAAKPAAAQAQNVDFFDSILSAPPAKKPSAGPEPPGGPPQHRVRRAAKPAT